MSLYLDYNEDLPDVSDKEKALSKLDSELKKGMINDFEYRVNSDELKNEIKKGHNYKFVGKVGQFTPIKKGYGGALLVREKDGKYYAVGGTKGYRWLESELVKELDKENEIDKTYYQKLVDDAIDTIGKYGDVEQFIE